ncbi:MAG: class II glutamine amidotransferase, partial [Proteobacteria bacterium]|nr:class II glutamine amidotransferase [Pseudomonadota bacterium]
SDSARAFEFLRDQVEDRSSNTNKSSPLFSALFDSIAQMIDRFPGEYNFLLSNGQLLFAFTNHRQFMFRRGLHELEGALILTTLARGLSKDKWTRVATATNRRGLLLAISGNDIVMKESV